MRDKKTFRIQVTGIVQGVGFRPFIYNLAHQFNLNGCVSNNNSGVIIDITANKEELKAFIDNILQTAPSSATINEYSFKELDAPPYNNFKILPTSENESINSPLTPDFAICTDCKTEINAKNNRRYQYPFTTCVSCGPRYAITNQFPFDRASTTIAEKQMCKTCAAEYHAPTNKRFHSQTNTCPDCGFKLTLTDNKGLKLTSDTTKIFDTIPHLIDAGKVLAIKNTNGYLFCCDASNKRVINLLRKRKKRPHKPFAVLYPHLKAIKNDFFVQKEEIKALESSECPIVILSTKKEKNTLATNEIAPSLKRLGIMLPSSALMQLIASNCNKPLVATSGNIHGSAIAYDSEVAQKQLSSIADYFIHHGLSINFPQDDSVITLFQNQTLLLRRSRGYAPNFFYNKSIKSTDTIAMGAHLKSTITYTTKNCIYTSQYIGNLDDYTVSERFQQILNKYISLFKTKPKTVLIDEYSGYQSSIMGKALAKQWNVKCYAIQHHKAHFTSVLAEHHLFSSKEKILGVIWDGVGLGSDNNIWGGEFFVYHQKAIKRINHFEYFDWIANDKMSKESRISLLCLIEKEKRILIEHKFKSEEWRIYNKVLEENTLKTSSVGRIFDAVASLLTLTDFNSYEGEAALLLEEKAREYKGTAVIDLFISSPNRKPSGQYLIKELMHLIEKGYSKEHLAYSFIYTLSKILIDIAISERISTVACSGGVFQNTLLLEITQTLAKKHKIKIKRNLQLSPNDENISLGQLMYYENIENDKNYI